MNEQLTGQSDRRYLRAGRSMNYQTVVRKSVYGTCCVQKRSISVVESGR
jgi:hypothetical protein